MIGIRSVAIGLWTICLMGCAAAQTSMQEGQCHASVSLISQSALSANQTKLSFSVSVDVQQSSGRFSYSFADRDAEGQSHIVPRDSMSWTSSQGNSFVIDDIVQASKNDISDIAIDDSSIICESIS
ncbi:MAG: hypothetical protein WDM89_07610 [Rhizomicrobium sp.]